MNRGAFFELDSTDLVEVFKEDNMLGRREDYAKRELDPTYTKRTCEGYRCFLGRALTGNDNGWEHREEQVRGHLRWSP